MREVMLLDLLVRNALSAFLAQLECAQYLARPGNLVMHKMHHTDDDGVANCGLHSIDANHHLTHSQVYVMLTYRKV